MYFKCFFHTESQWQHTEQNNVVSSSHEIKLFKIVWNHLDIYSEIWISMQIGNLQRSWNKHAALKYLLWNVKIRIRTWCFRRFVTDQVVGMGVFFVHTAIKFWRNLFSVRMQIKPAKKCNVIWQCFCLMTAEPHKAHIAWFTPKNMSFAMHKLFWKDLVIQGNIAWIVSGIELENFHIFLKTKDKGMMQPNTCEEMQDHAKGD